MLELNGNQLGLEGVQAIVDAIETSNYSLKQIGLLSNHCMIPGTTDDEDALSPPEPNPEEDRLLSYQVHQRLPCFLERNRFLTRRIRTAALKTIGPARVLLTARRLTVEETARNVIDTIGSRSTVRPFPLIDLPVEVVYHIARHCSGDPYAFSESQYARMIKEAEDKNGPKQLWETKERLQHLSGPPERFTQIARDVRDDWLRKGGWDKWDPGRITA